MTEAKVFSTSVEVFPKTFVSVSPSFSLLHVRGGVSRSACSFSASMTSSPRPWRCFLEGFFLERRKSVFSTSVEVFLEAVTTAWEEYGLLHVRGGVSFVPCVQGGEIMSSPRPWRCF